MGSKESPAESIFSAALAKDSAEDRARYLDEACGGDAELRGQIERLLQAHPVVGNFLKSLPDGFGLAATLGTADLPLREVPGTHIGPYKLLQQIGDGGMGVVFLAEQTHPVRRQVALKVIKAGMDTRQVVARFEAERQALALMDHVNIARVLDAGATESGRPYFVMELVRGVPITRYCDESHLTPRQRLELFVPICQAIQHAHQKGIIHRDIKPSNVMVTLYDGKPVPKVIDFGVAKATEQKLTDRTLFTHFGTAMGTLEYMSPEQAEMSALGVDTRSDIYSLGVLLYELLTGSTPLSSKRIKGTAYAEILRLIKEEEPPRPSTRLSDSGDALASISAQRQMEPAKLSRLMRGELDWIVMKPLEKDRNRRYESANAFAADVQRYLADEPVQACPPSARYRFWKFARRNRAWLATAGLVLFFIVLLGGLVGWGIRDRDAREQEVAREAARKLTLTEEGVRRALDRGAKSRAELHALLNKPRGVQELLNQPARWELFLRIAHGELVQARQLATGAEGGLAAELTEGINELEQQISADQFDYDLAQRLESIRLDRATLSGGSFNHSNSAKEYSEAFDSFAVLDDPAAVALRISSSPIKDQLVASLDDWAFNAVLLRNPGLAKQLLAVARHAAPDPAWGDRLRQLDVWSDREALRKLVAEAPAAGLSPNVLHLVGSLLRDVKDPLEQSWLRSAQAEHPADFWLNFNLAAALAKSDPVEAAGYYRVALAVRPSCSAAYGNLGITLHDQQKFPEAIAAYHKAIALDPKNASRTYSHLSHTFLAQQRFSEAVAACDKAIELDPDYAMAHFNLGLARIADGDPLGAIAAYDKVIALDPRHAPAHCGRGTAFLRLNKPSEATAAYHKAIELDPTYAMAHYNLGVALRNLGKVDGAIDAYRQAIQLQPDFVAAHVNLGLALSCKGGWDDAITAYRTAIRLQPDRADAHHFLAIALSDKGRHGEALDAMREALRLEPHDAMRINELGWLLVNAGHVEEAIACYGDMIRLRPDDPWPQQSLAWLLATGPDPKYWDAQRAVELITRSGELSGKAGGYWRILGAAHYRAGNWIGALAALQKSVEIGKGGDGIDWFFLAMAHSQSGNKAEARVWYDKAVGWTPRTRGESSDLPRFRAEADQLMGIAGGVEVAPPPTQKQ